MTATNDIWKLVYERLSAEFSETVCTLWFSSVEPFAMNDTGVVLFSDSDMKANILNRKYLSALERAYEEIVGFPLRVTVLSKESNNLSGEAILEELERGNMPNPFSFTAAAPQTTVVTPGERTEEPTGKKEDILSPLEEKGEADKGISYPNIASREYTFENFIVGKSNDLAHAASLAVANNAESPDYDASQSYNPLFIYGQSGLGKTHLLYAIINKVKEKNPTANIIYIKGEAFTNQMIEAISNQTTVEFRNKYRKADLLLIDDIQFIAGKNSTQEEFFHTFNALYEDHKHIILTSDRPPKDIKTLEERLKSRFEWGLIVDIQPPDLELRAAILLSKAQNLNIQVPPDVQTYLADKLKNNIRQMEGVLKKLAAFSHLTGSPITVESAQNCIADIMQGQEPTHVTVDRILEMVARKYNVTTEEIKGNRRSKEVVQPRHIAIYLIRKVTDMSFPAIGKLFNRDHSTILSSVDVIEKRKKSNPDLDQELNDLMEDIQKNTN